MGKIHRPGFSRKFFDEVNHELILKAVSHVMEEKWVLMYVESWLKMPVQKKDGTIEQTQGRGTPQGGVISPILANLYLYFTMDKWLAKHYAQIRFGRYADDAVIHCRSLAEAEHVKSALIARLAEVKLRVNESKTHIAYCKDYVRKGNHETVSLTFWVSVFNRERERADVTARVIWHSRQNPAPQTGRRLSRPSGNMEHGGIRDWRSSKSHQALTPSFGAG